MESVEKNHDVIPPPELIPWFAHFTTREPVRFHKCSGKQRAILTTNGECMGYTLFMLLVVLRPVQQLPAHQVTQLSYQGGQRYALLC